MSRSRDLIDSLRSEGALDTRGHFKLDAEKAREKLRKFQLEDPHHYVLEFVAAATLLGATHIDVVIDADEMTMIFDGGQISPAQLEDLYSAAFVRSEDATERAMRLLAIGATAAGALDFSILTIESASARLDILDSGASLSVSSLDTPKDRTRIYMRERRRVGHLVDFLSNLRGDLAEKTALRERCLYSHVVITLDGKQISHGHTLPYGTKGPIAFETEHEAGVLGFLSSGKSTEVHMLQHGVLVSSYHTDSSLVSVRAVVESDRLTKNLSQSAFVQDDAWHDVFHNVLRVTMHASLAEYLSRELGLRADGVSVSVAPGLRSWLRGIAVSIFDEVARWREVSAEPAPQTMSLASALERARIWEVCDRVLVDDVPVEYVSLEQARAMAGGVTLSFSHAARRALEVPEDFSPVLLSRKGDETADVLTRYTGLLRRSASHELEVAHERRQNVKQWARNPHDGALDLSTHPLQSTMEGNELRVTAGRSSSAHRSLQVVLVHDGHVLRRHEVHVGALRDVTLVVSGSLPVDRRHKDVSASKPYALAVAPAADLVFEVLERSFEASPDHMVGLAVRARNMLEALASQTMLVELMAALGVRHLFEDERLSDELLEVMSPIWSLHVVLERSSSLARRALAVEELGAFATRPIMPVLGGETISFLEFMRDAKEYGSAWILSEEEVDAQLRMDWATSELDRYVVLDPNWVEIVRAYCSPYIFRAADVIRNRARRKRFLDRESQAVEVEAGDVLERRSLATKRSDSGEIVQRSHARPGVIRARFFASGRPIDVIEIQTPVGEFDVAFQRTSLKIDASWQKLERDEEFSQVCALLREESYALIERRLLTLEKGVFTWGDEERAEFLDYVVGLHVVGTRHMAGMTATGLAESIDGFARVGGEAASYLDIRSELALHGRRLLIVSSSATVDASYIPTGMEDAPVHCMRTELEREAITSLFEDAVLIDVGHTAEREAEARSAREEFMKRAWLGLGRDDALASVAVRAGRFTGQLHLLPSHSSDMRGRVDVLVRHEGRLLVRLTQPVEMGFFIAVVDVEGLLPSTDYSGPRSGEDLASSCAALELPALELLRDVITRARFGQELNEVCGARALQLLAYARGRSSTRFERSLLAAPSLTLYPDVPCSINRLFDECADQARILTWCDTNANDTPVPEDVPVLCLRDRAQVEAAAALFAEFDSEDYSVAVTRAAARARRAREKGESEIVSGASYDEDVRARGGVGPQAPTAESPERLVLERVRSALKEARGSRVALLGDEDLAHLEHAPLGGAIAFAIRGSKTVRVDLEHPVARAACAHPDDPIALHMLASSIYSEINAREVRITDAHEAELLRALARQHLGKG